MTQLLKTHFVKIMLLAFVTTLIIACGGSSSSSSSSTTASAAVSEDGIGKYNAQNVKVEATPNPDLVAKGETLYKSTCSPCHQLTDARLVGPGLKGITKLRTAPWIYNMIVNATEMNAQDPEAKKLLETYMTPMPNQNLTDAELEAMYAFLQHNDAQ